MSQLELNFQQTMFCLEKIHLAMMLLTLNNDYRQTTEHIHLLEYLKNQDNISYWKKIKNTKFQSNLRRAEPNLKCCSIPIEVNSPVTG
jgi:hypothetical protein